jgi:hypothetical protein
MSAATAPRRNRPPSCAERRRWQPGVRNRCRSMDRRRGGGRPADITDGVERRRSDARERRVGEWPGPSTRRRYQLRRSGQSQKVIPGYPSILGTRSPDTPGRLPRGQAGSDRRKRRREPLREAISPLPSARTRLPAQERALDGFRQVDEREPRGLEARHMGGRPVGSAGAARGATVLGGAAGAGTHPSARRYGRVNQPRAQVHATPGPQDR